MATHLFLVLLLAAVSYGMPPPGFGEQKTEPTPATPTTPAIPTKPAIPTGIYKTPPSASPQDPLVDSFSLPMQNPPLVLAPNTNGHMKPLHFDPQYQGVTPGHYLGDVNQLDTPNGVFTAVREGVFLFTASVHLQEQPSSEAQIQSVKEVTIALCIDGDSNEALVSHGVLTGTTTTLSVAGNLQLAAGQKATVKIRNRSDSSIKVLESSTFSAHRLH